MLNWQSHKPLPVDGDYWSVGIIEPAPRPELPAAGAAVFLPGFQEPRGLASASGPTRIVAFRAARG